jgi:hypothetical protein
MTSFVTDLPGAYVVSLTVTNSNGSDTASVTVSTVYSPPVAAPGPNQTVAVGSLVTLNGSGSTDVDGNPLTYQWSLISMPAGSQAVLANSRSVVTTFVADLAGTYVVQLVVNDGNSNSLPATVTIATVNSPPVANAGLNQVVNLGALVQLNGSGSTDVNGDLLQYLWSFNSVPAGSKATLSNPTLVNPTFTADLPGSYVVQLVVNDGIVHSAPSTVTITTNALQPPTANAGPAQIVAPGATVTLSGSGTDPQNLPLTYSWSLITLPTGSGAALVNPNSPTPTFIADLPGQYVAQLIVNDGFLSSKPSTVSISTSSTPPVAEAGSNLNVAVSATVTLNGSGSYSLNNRQLTYSWSFTALPQGSQAVLRGANTVSPSFVADLAGTYVAQLIVNDGILNSAPSTVTITAGANVTTPIITVQLNSSAVGLTHRIGGTVTLSAPAAISTVITLSSSPIGLIGFNPSSVTIAAGSSSGTFTVTGEILGSATITAASSGYASGTASVSVVDLGGIAVGTNVIVTPGQTVPISVTLSAPAPADGTTVTLTSLNTSILTVSPTVFIAPGATTPATPAQVTGVLFGSTNVTASAVAYTGDSETVTVAETLSFSPQTVSVGVGETANVSLNLSAPAPTTGLPLTLTSSNTGVATVPSRIVIYGGLSSTSVTVTGVASGTSTITASSPAANVASGTMAVTVAPPGSITLPNISVGLGQTVAFPIALTLPAPSGGLTVNLSSGNSAVLGISPATVNIAAGQTQPATQPTVTANSLGQATITASASGYGSANQVVLTTGALSFNPGTTTIVGAGSTNLTLTLSAPAPTGGVTVNLSASPSGVVTVPQSVQIAAGATSVTVPVTAVAGGTATITASAANVPNVTNAAATVTVQSAGSITITASPTLAPGQSVPLSVTLSSAAPAAVTVSLSSNNPNVAAVPASVTIPAGQASPAAQPTVTGVNFGSATITASAAGYATGTANVAVSGSLSFTQQTSTITGLATENLTVTLSAPAPAAMTVNLSAVPSGVVSVPSTVTIAQGATSASVPVTGLSLGTATITASAANIPNVTNGTATVTVQSAGSITITANSPLAPGQSVPLSVTLSAAAPAAVTVSLSSNNPNVAAVPASVTIPAGQASPAAQPTVTGVNFGSAAITASAAGYTAGTANVAVSGSLSFTQQTSTITGLATENLTVTLSAPAPAAMTVNLSAVPSGVVSVPSTVTIALGATSASVPVTGASLGTATITASSSLSNVSSGTTSVTVQSGGTIGLPSGVSLNLGQSAPFQVTLPVAPASAVTVSLSSSNANVGISPATVTIPAGQTQPSTAPQVTGNNLGSATITASSPAYTSGSRSVQVTGTISFSPQTLSIAGTATQSLTLTLSGPAPTGGITFNVTSTNPAAATVGSSTATIAAGATTTSVFVTGVAAGSATIQASAANLTTATASVTVTNAVSINVPSTLAVAPGNTASFPISLVNAASSTVTLALSSANTGIATVSASQISVAAGQTTSRTPVIVTGVSAGTTSITVTPVGSSLAPAASTVNVGFTISISPSPLTIVGSGVNGTMNITLSGLAPAGGIVVNLTSSNTAVANVPPSVTISAGASSGAVRVTSVGLGDCTVTLSATGIPTVTGSVAVVGPLTVTSTTLPNGVVGSPYSATVAASGGTPPYTWSATGLPTGLSINSSTGVISGSTSQSGASTVTVTAQDSTSPAPLTASAHLQLSIIPVLSIATPALPNGIVGVAYSTTMAATGGATPLTWSATGLPAGVTINPNSGAISGAPTAAGTNAVTVAVTDSTSPTPQTASKSYSVTIAPTLSITTVTLPAGNQNVSYTAQLSATGGTSPYTWSSTSLPAGLTLSASTGAITGTPTAIGTTSVTVTATDSTSPTHLTVSQTFSIAIVTGPVITTASLPGGVATSAYTATVSATNGTTPYTWTAGGLPSGLSIGSVTGTISGTPSVSGTFTVNVTVTDSTKPTNQTGTKQYSLVIGPALSITTTSLPSGIAGLSYSSTVNATGGTTPYTWSASGFPSGLTINAASGAISGSPASSGTFSVTVTATDSTAPPHQSATQVLSLSIAPALAISTSPLPTGVMNTGYSATIAASNGTAPFTWSASGLPSGLSIGSSSGTISGTTASTGTFAVTITVTDSTSPTKQTASQQFSLQIVTGLAITTASLPNGAANLAYSTTVAAAGGVTPLSWSASGLPSTLTIGASSGIISGTPTAGGTYTVTVSVIDSTSPTHQNVSKTFPLTIAAPLSITNTSPLPNGAANIAYSTTLTAAGGNSPLSWTATGLPSTLTIGASSGIISGTPTAVGPYPVSVTVKDSTGPTPQSLTKLFSLTVAGPVSVTTSSLPNGAAGLAYSTTVTATGGNAPVSWSATGLPSTLTINSSSGIISGTPTAGGTYSVTVTATDSTSLTPQTASKPLSLTIAPTLAITSTSLPTGAVGLAYSSTVGVSGGNSPLSWSASGLPPGMSINSSSGNISGTPQASGTFPVSLSVSDATIPTAQLATKQLSLTVVAALTITTTSLPNGVIGVGYNTSLGFSGGTAPISWIATSLPSGLTMSSNGTISGTPTVNGPFTVTVTATDSAIPTPQTATKQLSLTIAAALTITTSSLPGGVTNTAYNTTLAATGGNAPLSWSATSLPSGLTLSSTGAITGTPGAVGTFTFSVAVTDNTSPTQQSASRRFSLTVSSLLTITTATLPNGVQGSAYSGQVAVTGGTTPYAWSATGLPSGLSISSTTGIISGTPASTGPSTVTVTVTDVSSPIQTASVQFSLIVNTQLTITTAAPLPSGQSGVAYSASLAATGGTTPLTWTETGMPTTLAINSSTGAITGTPTGPGNYTVLVTATDSSSPPQVATKQFSLAIAVAKLAITSTSLPSGQAQTAYAYTVVRTGGTAPFNWSGTTGLPPGLSIGATTGQITGTPTAGGTFNVNLSVTDSSSPQQSASVTLPLTINGLFITTPSPLPGAAVGVAYSTPLAATGGSGQLTWTVSNLTGRSGLSLSSTGVLSGTPVNPGTLYLSVTVTDAANDQATATLALTIAPAPLTIPAQSLPIAVVNTAYLTSSSTPVQLAASGGTAPYTWAVSASTPLPAGLTLSTAGVISGTATVLSTTNVTFVVSDSGLPQQQASVTLTLIVSSTSNGGTVTVSSVSVGQNLQVPITITFNPALAASSTLTVTSSNPSAVLLGASGLVGSGSVSSSVAAGTSSLDTYVQAAGSAGTVVTITATLPGYATGVGTVTIANTGFVVSGANETNGAIATFEGVTTPLTVTAYQLDQNNNPVQNTNEAVRAGFTINVPVSSSATSVGTVSASTVAIASPASSGTVNFVASSTTTGAATVSAGPLAGYGTANGSSVAFNVQPADLVPFNGGAAVTIGNNLQTGVSVARNGDPTAAAQVTITSNNASLLAFSTTPTGNTGNTAPTSSITLTIPPNQTISPTFYAHAHGSSGTVGYTVSATGYTSVSGSVTLAPSGLVIVSPAGSDQGFQMSLQSSAATLVVNTAWLSGGSPAATQAVAYGVTIPVTVTSGNTNIGTVSGSPVTLTAGLGADSTTFATFSPAGTLSTTSITASATGYQSASVSVTVNAESLIVSDGAGGFIGNNLESQGSVIVPGTPTSDVQITVAVTSGNILLSNHNNGPWSSSINVTVAAGSGSNSAAYYIESLASSGTASYSVSTTGGFGPATDKLTLTPSGFMIYSNAGGSSLTISLSSGPTALFTVFAAQLTNGAFNQVQSVASPVTVGFTNFNSAAGSFPSTLTFPAGTGENTSVVFTLGTANESTTISITQQPTGFVTPGGLQPLQNVSVTVTP